VKKMVKVTNGTNGQFAAELALAEAEKHLQEMQELVRKSQTVAVVLELRSHYVASNGTCLSVFANELCLVRVHRLIAWQVITPKTAGRTERYQSDNAGQLIRSWTGTGGRECGEFVEHGIPHGDLRSTGVVVVTFKSEEDAANWLRDTHQLEFPAER
jgi:hypothetical protein